MSDIKPIKTAIFVRPTKEPLSLTQATDHLRVTDSAEDGYITTLISLARERVEDDTGRRLLTQTWLQYFDEFPSGDELELAYGPVQSITSVTYKKSDATSSTFAAADYDLDAAAIPPVIRLGYGEVWPTDTLYPTNPVTVTFVAGYLDASEIPAPLIHAMKLLLTHWYENREVVAPVKLLTIPMGYEALIASYRLRWF